MTNRELFSGGATEGVKALAQRSKGGEIGAYKRFCKWWEEFDRTNIWKNSFGSVCSGQPVGKVDLFKWVEPTFYWWRGLEASTAFVFSPGDLAMKDGKYVVVDGLPDECYHGLPNTCDMVYSEESGLFEPTCTPRVLSDVCVTGVDGSYRVGVSELSPANMPDDILEIAKKQLLGEFECPILKGAK